MAIGEFEFYWNLTLRKSQADSLLNRLAKDWLQEFDALCQLLAVSAVVYADETSWCINSVWAFLSDRSRITVFGCHKDGDTLAVLLDKEKFQGILVSDDAAVYQGFSQAQKCWAHLLRKAIRLTLKTALEELNRWQQTGISCFLRLVQKLKPPALALPNGVSTPLAQLVPLNNTG